MNQAEKESRTGLREGAEVRLADRPQLPPRVRKLLGELFEHTVAYFHGPIEQMLELLEQELFKRADRAASNDEQQRHFETIGEIKRGRADAVPRFLAHMESSLARVADPPAATQARQTARTPGQLELVGDSELEAELAVQDLSNRAEVRHSQALYALGRRFGVLGACPAFDADSVPLGPDALANALRCAIAPLDIATEYRVLCFRLFDRNVMATIGAFYEVLNSHLARAGILPNLNYQPPAARASTARDGGTDAEPTASRPAAEPTPEPPAAKPAASSDRGKAPVRGDPAAAGEAEASRDDGGQLDAELFVTLRELLAGRRHRLGAMAPKAPSNAHLVSQTDLQDVLASLQGQPPPVALHDNRQVMRSVGQLKQDLLGQLRRTSPKGHVPRLTDEDTDTIDLVAMLFDYLGQNLPDGSTHSLLARLQVPVLRAALGDKSFFTRRNHPARLLLNSIAENGAMWLGDDEADRAVLDKMQRVVDRVTHEYQGDVALFEDLLGDLSRHMNVLAQRAEIAERRHVEAAQGRERLANARERAGTAVARLMRGRATSPVVEALLGQAWTDVLALTALRHGEDSNAYRRQLAIADQLVRRDGVRAPLDAVLREEVQRGLAQVGLHDDDVGSIVEQVFAPPAADRDAGTPPAAPPELPPALRDKPRFGSQAAKPAETVAANDEQLTPLDEAEQRMLQRLRTLPFGTWFDFVTNQQGATARRKLAWYSTLTGRCLFVNARGARVDERRIEQLARALVQGQARFVEAPNESLIDRAWRAIVGTLKQFGGGAARAEAEPVSP